MKMKRYPKLEKTYKFLIGLNWLFDEYLPDMGIMVMRKNNSSTETPSWAYCTINKQGKIRDGCYQQ
jgi:hypothetical protein